ncbi:hypothetical protein AB7W80_11910 [Providencia rettgeri]
MKDKKALVISGIHWNATWQRHQEFSSILANNGYQVDFLQANKTTIPSLGKIKNILVNKNKNKNKNKTPEKIKIKTSWQIPPIKFSYYINRVLSIFFHRDILSKEYDIIISYVPTDLSVYLLKKNNNKFIFDCVRAFSIWSGYSTSLYKNEKYIYKNSKNIICDSFFIKDIYLKNNKVTQIITPIEALQIKPREINEIKSICYFGSISKHIDISLFEKILERNIDIYFWGVVDKDITLPNSIKIMGYESDQNILAKKILEKSDAIIIPYIGNMDGVFPAKLILSISMEIPIFISSFFDSEKLKEILYVYNSHDDFFNLLDGFQPQEFVEKNKVAQFFLHENNSSKPLLQLIKNLN